MSMEVVMAASAAGMALTSFGLAGLCYEGRRGLLMVLLYLELCNVGLYVMLMVPLVLGSLPPGSLMFFLSCFVSEAAMGLAVLVMSVRSYGSDSVGASGVITL